MDYNRVIEDLTEQDIIRIMETLGVKNYKMTNEAIIFPTICHNINPDEASMKLYYYKDNHFFYCYTECGGISVFKMIEHVYKTRGIEYDWYNDVYLLITGGRRKEGLEVEKKELLGDKFGRRRREPTLEQYPAGVLDVFEKIYPSQWLAEGITKEAMDKFNIRFSISQNKIIIPHYTPDGKLIGIRGRALNTWEIENIGKYMPVQIEQKWYKHPLGFNLYGLDQTKDNIKKSGYVFLFEGEKSVLRAEGFQRPNCGVAVCGSVLNKYQIDLLRKYCDPNEFIICFDKEEEGTEDKYFNKLKKLGQKYSNYGKFSFIYDFHNRLEMKDSPVDKGEEVFNELLKERIYIKQKGEFNAVQVSK